jgi:GGDEF domain-containing protein
VAPGPAGVEDGDVGTLAAVGSEARFEVGADGLFAASIALAQLRMDPAPATRLLASWSTRAVSSNPDSSRRYPWPMDSKFAHRPAYVPPRETWHAWRPSEEEARLRDPGVLEARFLPPPIIADTCELLERLSEDGVQDAARLLELTLPVMRRDLAREAFGGHAWGDTWALWNLARRPRALRHLHPFALAIADTYAARAIADGGIGRGSRFPFHDRPLVSVSAQLASGLLALGIHPKLTGQLSAWVRGQERSDRSFADASEPPDPLTTLVAADLLTRLDPDWDPGSTIRWLDARRRADGTVVAYGPEVAWLTLAADELADRASRPFFQRFRWPQLAVAQRDRRTGLPFLGYLVDLSRLYAEIASLARIQVELAFLDLAGFGVWNDRFGMAAGDEVLRFLAAELAGLPDGVAIRDGGDEFIFVGAPGQTGLAATMAAFRVAFPARFASRFGDDAPPVAIRVVTTITAGADLVAARDLLGREIATLKRAHPTPPPEGVSALAVREVATRAPDDATS